MSPTSLLRLSLPPFLLFFFNYPATTQIYTLSLHDALPISPIVPASPTPFTPSGFTGEGVSVRSVSNHGTRSEEHTSELQSLRHLVCRLLLEKKKNKEKRKYEPARKAHSIHMYGMNGQEMDK